MNKALVVLLLSMIAVGAKAESPPSTDRWRAENMAPPVSKEAGRTIALGSGGQQASVRDLFTPTKAKNS